MKGKNYPEIKEKILIIEFNNKKFKIKFSTNNTFNEIKKKCEEKFNLKEEQIKRDIKFYLKLDDKSLMEIEEEKILKIMIFQENKCNLILKLYHKLLV